MLILNLKKDNTYFEKKLNIYTNSLNYGHLKCPHCHSSAFIKYGSYTRNVIYICENSKINSMVLRIQRVKCKSCGKTHALLPEGIIPYKQISTELIIYILIEILNGNMKKLIEIFPFDESVLKRIYKQFKERHLSKIKTMFQNIHEIDCLNIMNNNTTIQEQYIIKYNCCFMQIKLGCLGVCPS